MTGEPSVARDRFNGSQDPRDVPIERDTVAARLVRLETALVAILEELTILRQESEEASARAAGIAPRLLERLTERERLIVRRVVAGVRVPSIARELYLSQSTIRNHLSAAFHKLGVRSQAELLDLAQRGPTGRDNENPRSTLSTVS
jgi:DNA-binding NarL/FixJ family response regulator